MQHTLQPNHRATIQAPSPLRADFFLRRQMSLPVPKDCSKGLNVILFNVIESCISFDNFYFISCLFSIVIRPDQTPLQGRRCLKESFNVFLQYLRLPVAVTVTDGHIRTAMKRHVRGPLNHPDRSTLWPARLLCSTMQTLNHSSIKKILQLNAHIVIFASKNTIKSVSHT